MRPWIRRAALWLLPIAAGLWLWRWSEDRQAAERLRGGPLFDFAVSEIETVEMRRLQGSSRLVRDAAASWILTGTTTDLVDPQRVESALAPLVAGIGFQVIAGTRPDERRFGFGGEQALELVFHLQDGRQQRLALGDYNPVSDMFYASGAGRPGVFGVGGDLHAAAFRLPDSVRWPSLLPPLRAADLDSIHLGRRGDETLVMVRLDDGRWWLRRPAAARPLAGKAGRYHERYQDRRRERDGVVWLLADERRLRELVFRATETAIVQFAPPDPEPAEVLGDLGLDHPYRVLDLWPRAGGTWRVEFGELWQEARPVVPARRQGALVMTRGEALLPLEGPLADFLDLGALSLRTADADSFRVDEPQRPLLWARRAAVQAEQPPHLQNVWDPVAPAGWEFAFARRITANHLDDLQVGLDRLDCLEVLEPQQADPLRQADRWRLRIWLPAERFGEVWFGTLLADGRPAVWEPADGKCLVVSEQMLVTLRNLRAYLQPRQDG